jgi:3',5'-cyclic AMP phosphodiesterase CpdA
LIIAQITDCHLKAGRRLAYRKVDTAAALEACVRHLLALPQRPDVVLVTGDLGDLGTAAEYELFREIVAPLPMPLYVIPGNHDNREAMRAAFAEHAYIRQDDTFLHYAIDDWPVRLIGLDSTIPGAPGGDMCPRRLEWLSRALAQSSSKPTLLFIHHPPFLTGIGHMDRQNCANASAFGAVVEANRQVRMLLCGHVHRAIHVQWHGIEASICPGTSHAVALDLDPAGPSAFTLEPPACRLIVCNEAAGTFVTHLSPIGPFDGPHPFFTPRGQLID